MKFPKHSYVRSPALLKAAREIPCQNCTRDDGTVVAAHSNWQGGKGRGIKADDNLIASLCHKCHSEIDQGSKLTKEERQQIWYRAHNKTVALLQKRELWPTDCPLPEFHK
jgi:predicted Fe-S protein YdhL (DUF1289 family)